MRIVLILEDKLLDIAIDVLVKQTGLFCSFSQIFGLAGWDGSGEILLYPAGKMSKKLSIRAP